MLHIFFCFFMSIGKSFCWQQRSVRQRQSLIIVEFRGWKGCGYVCVIFQAEWMKNVSQQSCPFESTSTVAWMFGWISNDFVLVFIQRRHQLRIPFVGKWCVWTTDECTSSGKFFPISATFIIHAFIRNMSDSVWSDLFVTSEIHVRCVKHDIKLQVPCFILFLFFQSHRLDVTVSTTKFCHKDGSEHIRLVNCR